MSTECASYLKAILDRHGRAPSATMDILRDVQEACGCVPPEAVTILAREMDVPRIQIASFVSFYSFLSETPKGNIVIRVCDDVVDRMKGFTRVMDAFQQALGVRPGETTADGTFTLETTPCIGLSDQAPAALVNDVPVTSLSSDKAWDVVRELQVHKDPARLVTTLGDGNNAHVLVHSMVRNNVREPGPLIFSPIARGDAIRKALAVSPREVLRALKAARLRGRGGAGFPTGLKWEFCREAPGSPKYVFCNADEGEPGTFKDRVILTERPDRVFAGMTVAGYAIGAAQGILYLRGEYAYLRPFLEDVLRKRRDDGLLGKSVCGHHGFDFDIRIQMGAGAYVCGEESALLSSCEGLRGDPRNRPPFPAQRGYLGKPTVVNNVETLCCVTKIMEDGPATFAAHGSQDSTGTKLISISGDCRLPGVYEVPFGITLSELLERAGGVEAHAVQVGGPSGQIVGHNSFGRRIAFEDLATGGSVVVFGPGRDLLEVVRGYQAFFAEESCGYCTPCRVGNRLLVGYLDRLIEGRGEPGDLAEMTRVATTMKKTSRCGLGQTACNPFLTAHASFPDIFERVVADAPWGERRSFDLVRAVARHRGLRGDAPPVVEELPDWAD